jgi:hypothetical protein
MENTIMWSLYIFVRGGKSVEIRKLLYFSTFYNIFVTKLSKDIFTKSKFMMPFAAMLMANLDGYRLPLFQVHSHLSIISVILKVTLTLSLAWNMTRALQHGAQQWMNWVWRLVTFIYNLQIMSFNYNEILISFAGANFDKTSKYNADIMYIFVGCCQVGCCLHWRGLPWTRNLYIHVYSGLPWLLFTRSSMYWRATAFSANCKQRAINAALQTIVMLNYTIS